MDNILCAVGDLLVQHLGFFDVGVDAHIADGDAAAEMFAERGCTGLMPGQIDGLHQGYRLGRRRHALCHHAVIRSEHQQMLLFGFVMYLPGNTGKLNG